MAQQTINNGEGGGAVRGKLNDNFSELYARAATANTPDTPVTAATINAAIAAAAAAGGGDVLLPTGVIDIDATLDVTTSNVRLVGVGADTSHGAGTNMTQKTVLRWTGASGATMVRIRTPYGATAQRRYGQGMIGIELNGNSLAAIGLELDSIAFGQFENVHVRHCTSTQYNLTCGITGTDGPAGEALDLQMCSFSRMSFDTRNTGFTATTAKGWVLTGSTNANTSGNRFELLTGIYSSGTAYDIPRADNNVFIRCSAFRAGGSGTVYTWDLTGHDSAFPGLGAYANLFIQCGWDATFGFRMTASNGADSATLRVNMVIAYDEANGGGPPVVGGNSRVTYLSKAGVLSDITRAVLRQQDANPDSGFTTWDATFRHDDWATGAKFKHDGNGFTRTDEFQNVNVQSALGRYEVDGIDVVGPRRTGWTAATGTASRATFATGTVTTAQLAERVKALIDDLIVHGLIGA
jgi:hypothetical protein